MKWGIASVSMSQPSLTFDEESVSAGRSSVVSMHSQVPNGIQDGATLSDSACVAVQNEVLSETQPLLTSDEEVMLFSDGGSVGVHNEVRDEEVMLLSNGRSVSVHS